MITSLISRQNSAIIVLQMHYEATIAFDTSRSIADNRADKVI